MQLVFHTQGASCNPSQRALGQPASTHTHTHTTSLSHILVLTHPVRHLTRVHTISHPCTPCCNADTLHAHSYLHLSTLLCPHTSHLPHIHACVRQTLTHFKYTYLTLLHTYIFMSHPHAHLFPHIFMLLHLTRVYTSYTPPHILIHAQRRWPGSESFYYGSRVAAT